MAAKNRNKDSPKNIETVETPESSPNELALAAAAAAQAEYFFDPFSAAVAQAQQNTLPTPEISPQDETVSQNMFFFLISKNSIFPRLKNWIFRRKKNWKW